MKILGLLFAWSAAGWSAARLPVAFEPNRGQGPAAADYVARGRGYTLALRAGRAEWISRRSHVSTLLPGARVPARGVAESPLPGVVNYLRGRDASRWLTDIPTYARVRYRGVYRGIDIVYYGGEEGRLEYDFVVAPGADPRQIRLRYQGARGVRLDAEGDLLIETADGTIRQHRPDTYQEFDGARRQVVGRYVLRGKTVRFDLAGYDRARPLVIDPALTWATYFGGSSSEDVFAVTADSGGNVYVAGRTLSAQGDDDCFASRLNPAGATVAYTSLIGGSGNDQCRAIAVDGAGSVYLAGQTDSDDLPIVNQSQNPALTGLGLDGFFMKLDSTGKTIVYSNYLGGSANDAAFGLALDANNNLYLVGGAFSADFPVTRTGAQRTLAGGLEAFLSQFDANGTLVYSTYLGGAGDDIAFAVAVDGSGNMYVTGSTTSTNFPVTSGVFQSQNAGGMDIFVVKVSAGGSIAYATYLGGKGDEEGAGIAVDGLGAAYITGDTASSDFPTRNAYQGAFAGGPTDIFVTKLSADGAALVYSTYLGGSGQEIANAIATDGAGNAYIGGATNSTNFPVSDAFQSANRGGVDGIVAALNPAGNALVFSSLLGGTGDDIVYSLSVNCAAGLLVGGTTASNNFPATPGVVQPTFGGAQDGFVARIALGGAPPSITSGGIVNSATFASAPVAPGSLISIFGSNLAITSAGAPSAPWPTTLGGASVTINGTPAPLDFVNPTVAVVQVPYEIGPGSASATVTGCGGASSPASFQVAQAAPYIFPAGSGAAVVNPNNGINASDNRAHAGDTVVVYLTGIGPLDNPVPTGAPAPLAPLSKATLPNSASIGGSDAHVAFLGLAPQFVGLAQANLVVPSLGPGSYDLVITVGGVASNTVKFYVQ